jgi:coenzyme F420 hydrogenase subunit beta
MGVREEMAEKCYADLKKEVWETGACARCGACIAVCPADALFFSHRGESESASHPSSTGYCKMETDGVPCGACYLACPRTGEKKASKAPLGNYLKILAARAAFPVERKQSGGAVTAILASALDEGLIDAVVTVTEDRWTLRPRSVVITSSGELVEHAGSRYNWWVPLLAALKEAIIVHKCQRVAVVGVPCAASAVARIRESDLDLHLPFARAIRLVIGLFCTESFDYNRLIRGTLRDEYKIEPWEIRRIDVKGRLEVQKTNGEVLRVPLGELGDCIPGGCRICTDLSAEDADISAGAIGSPEGYTTLIIRTPAGEGFVGHAIDRGMLEAEDGVDTAIITRLAEKKREHGWREP